MTDDPITVLVADDHPVVRDGLRTMLETDPDLTLVGEAADGEEAVERATTQQPDVVVMDLHLPKIDGIAATRRIIERAPHIAIVVLTMLDDDASLLAALRAGARGYLLKGSEPRDVIRAVKAVSRGEAVFGPEVANRVLASFTETERPQHVPFPELTEREREVLDLLARGQRSADIAQHLGIAPKTIRNHISNILNKLCVLDRTEAILRAREAGLGKP